MRDIDLLAVVQNATTGAQLSCSSLRFSSRTNRQVSQHIAWQATDINHVLHKYALFELTSTTPPQVDVSICRNVIQVFLSLWPLASALFITNVSSFGSKWRARFFSFFPLQGRDDGNKQKPGEQKPEQKPDKKKQKRRREGGRDPQEPREPNRYNQNTSSENYF